MEVLIKKFGYKWKNLLGRLAVDRHAVQRGKLECGNRCRANLDCMEHIAQENAENERNSNSAKRTWRSEEVARARADVGKK